MHKPGRTAESVIVALNEFGYSHAANDDQTEFRFDIVSKSGSIWHSAVRLTPGSSVVQLHVEVSRPYYAERREWVAELVHRIDEKIAVLGGFGFRYGSGTAFFRYGLDLRGQEIRSEAIERMLNSCSFAIEVFRSAFELIDLPRISPERAVDIALMLHDVGEMANDPKEALKAVLRVETTFAPATSSSQNPAPLSLI